MGQELAKIESFRAELAKAETFQEISYLKSQAEAVAEFAKRLKLGKEKQDEIGVFLIEIETKKGAWLDKHFPHGGSHEKKQGPADVPCISSMQELGITKNQSSQSRLIAKEPELVQKAIESIKGSNNQVVTPNAVAKEIKKIKQEERRDEIKESLVLQELKPSNKKYRIIYADPPWSYGNAMPEYVTEPQDYYSLMSTKDICAMPVKEITENNAVLFMWSTSPHLPEALEVVKAWGFTYKTTFIWDKIKHNMGHYNSVRHEILLVCTKGACTPDVKKLFDSVVSIERTEHSKKPEEFRNIIETLYVFGNKIELFARQAPLGWDVFGNQIN